MYCQVVYICGCIPARIQHALADLPETLDDTYQRTLREINKADWEFAHRLLQFVAVASRPLRVEELAELLAYDFKAGQIPQFHEGWRLEDPVDAVLSTCASLLVIVDGGYGKVIQFSHFSVKEYLISTRLAAATDILPRRYHISMTPAHTLVAQACLGILLYLDKDVVTRDNLKKWPLAEYAAKNWVYHALFEGVSQEVGDGVKQLFDPRKPHLAVSVWIHDPWTQNRAKMFPPVGTPLHYAALWDLHFIVEFLVIEHSQDVHSRGFPRDATPLDLASCLGHVKAARVLIEHGADVMARNEDRETALHLASRNGQAEVARILIEHGTNVAAQNKDGETALHLPLTQSYWQIQERHVEVARMLIECGAGAAAQNKDGETPLHLASRNGHIEVARKLIERGAGVAAQNNDRETPLHLALTLTGSFLYLPNGQVEVTRMLIERGAEVAAQNKHGATPLHLASQNGQVEVARMLIERGADAATQNKDGMTPLHLALEYRQVKVARMLIQCGADAAAQNQDGTTPLHLALVYRQVDVTRMLIERGAGVAAQNKNGETPLHLASRSGQVEVACLLIEHGAEVASRNKDGETALHLASRNGQVKVVHMLIERGADVAAQDKHGGTPLHWASRPVSHPFQLQGLAEVSRILLEQGADVNAKNKDGLTPFRLASRSRYTEDTRVRIFLEHGAIESGDGAEELEMTSY